MTPDFDISSNSELFHRTRYGPTWIVEVSRPISIKQGRRSPINSPKSSRDTVLLEEVGASPASKDEVPQANKPVRVNIKKCSENLKVGRRIRDAEGG